MKGHVRLRLAGALALGSVMLAAVGCGGIADPTKNPVETFTGTIQPGGYAFHPFKVSKQGEYSVTLVSLTPPASVFVFVWLGTTLGDQCFISSQRNPQASPGRVALVGPISPGNYCVAVEDLGAFTVPETYTVQISHP